MSEANIKPRLIVEAVVIRADGTREDFGVIADSNNNNVKQTIWEKIGGLLHG